MRLRAGTALLFYALLNGCLLAQRLDETAGAAIGPEALTWTTEAVGPERFIAVPGRLAVVMGYPVGGLEIWAYPLQLVHHYQISFLPDNQTQAISGASLLRRIEYRPEEVDRVYVGTDFVVRERIFVPLTEPGAIFTYEVEGRRGISVQVHFDPSLNLMWPGALGGQSLRWDQGLSGYVLTEPLYGFSAKIASADASSHDPTGNPTVPSTEEGNHKTLTLQPKLQADGSKRATLLVGYDAPGTAADSGIIPKLEDHGVELRAEMVSHDNALLASAVRIETPDAELNRALAWSVLALDQAWVCDESLGCGVVAGYGPSRPGRRPQYDWFFAGDGLVAVKALLDAGEYGRAREELEFITKYQNKNNGMIWHELSQSAALVDWQTKYPYMYVHVDTTFSYLATLAHYVQVSGDIDFVKAHWKNIQQAYAYCASLVDPTTALPAIPAGKEGANEQERMRDELGLSSSWIAAAAAFAQMAGEMHSPEATSARDAADAARQAVASGYWDAQRHFWLAGHEASGAANREERPRPTSVLAQHVFSPLQTEQILDEIASPDFETDWGTRSLSASATRFDPNSYAAGSVSALESAEVAESFWQQHRPLTGWQIWHELLSWNTLDAQGHLHEVLAGDLYHPQEESVPEQTWSSAGYLSAAVGGLLGLSVQSGQHQATFAPHLPAQWNAVSIRNVHVGASVLDLQLSRDAGGITLRVDNSGDPVALTFSPEIPLGATLGRAVLEDTRSKATLQARVEVHAQDEHVTTTFLSRRGTSRCRIVYRGGVQVAQVTSAPLVGAASRDLKIVAISVQDHRLSIDAFVNSKGVNTLGLYTAWKPARVTGGSFVAGDQDSYLLRFDQGARANERSGESYVHKTMMVQF